MLYYLDTSYNKIPKSQKVSLAPAPKFKGKALKLPLANSLKEDFGRTLRTFLVTWVAATVEAE